jgi:hypothetical protein
MTTTKSPVRLRGVGRSRSQSLNSWTALNVNALQYTLGNEYHDSTVNGLPMLRSLEPYGTYRQPRQGRAYLFDGVNDFAISTSNIGITGSQARTVCWRGAANGTAALFWFGNNSAGQSFGALQLSGNWFFNGWSSGADYSFGAADSGLHSHILSYDGSTVRWYVDGVELGTGFTVALNTAGSGFSIGRRGGTANDIFLNGRCHECLVFRRVISSDERSLFVNRQPELISSSELRAWYPCNEESGTVGYDISGNGNHLTLTNITQSTFHATDTAVTSNIANTFGFTHGKLIQFTGNWTSNGWISDRVLADGETVYFSINSATPEGNILMVLTSKTSGMVSWDTEEATLQWFTSTQLIARSTTGTGVGVFATSTYTPTTVLGYTKSGTDIVVTVNNVVGTTLVGAATAPLRFAMAGHSSNPAGLLLSVGETLGGLVGTLSSLGVVNNKDFVISPDLSSLLSNDIYNRSLSYTGKAPYPANVEVPCITGDGSAVYVDLGSPLIPATADFELSLWYFNPGNTNEENVFCQRSTSSSAQRLFLAKFSTTTNTFVLYASSPSVTATVSGVTGWNFIRVTRVASSITLIINGVSSSLTYAGSIDSANTSLLAFTNSLASYSAGRVTDFRITTGGVTTYFPLQGGPGSSNTNRDVHWVASDGTYGVVANAITSGTVSTIWANRCPNAEDWCVNHGGKLAANGSFVPGNITGNLAADGNAKTLSKFGNPYSRINFNPFTAAELNGLGLETAYARGNNRQSVAPINTKFRRTMVDGDDRFFTTREALQ